MSMKEKPTAALKAMLMKNSGASATEVRSAIKELKKRGEDTPPPSMVTGGRDLNKGGAVKKEIPVLAISIGMGKMKKPKKKTEMAYGGMSGGKKHMYAAGGMVKDNPGLKALKAESPEAYKKITGK
jgi:hypothetical protein